MNDNFDGCLAILLLFAVIVFSYLVVFNEGIKRGKSELLKQQAIERGEAYYDSKTGKFSWPLKGEE